MNLGVRQACMRAWRTHCPSFLPDFVEICNRQSCMVAHVSTQCNMKHITAHICTRPQLESALIKPWVRIRGSVSSGLYD
jgi:hypothetical protein